MGEILKFVNYTGNSDLSLIQYFECTSKCLFSIVIYNFLPPYPTLKQMSNKTLPLSKSVIRPYP
jgi:hypothetical protein